MKIQYLAVGLMGSVLLAAPTRVLPGDMSQGMTLEEARAEIERLEQENQSLNEQIESNEMTIAEYKEQMADIEAQIAELQLQVESR